jgi:translocation and assembly module TamA
MTPREAHRTSMSSRRALLLLFCALLDAPLSQAADPHRYRVQFLSTGDKVRDSTLEETSQLLKLHTAAPVEPEGLIARAKSDVVRLRVVLESFGYYQGSVSIQINGIALDDPRLTDTLSALPPGSDARCMITFTLGPLYRLGRIDIDGTLPDSMRGALELAPGAPAVAADVLDAGVRLQTTLEDRGFAFAKVDPPIAYERADEHVLDVRFHVETGPKVKLGEIRIEGLRAVHESLVRARLPFHPGDPYSATKLDAARRDLLGLGVFVTVSVRLGNGTDSLGRVPVIFRVGERPRHAIGIRAAYSSDLGGSGGFTWSDRNLFGNAEQLDLSAAAINVGGNASRGIGYDTSARYAIPNVGSRRQTLQFAVAAIKQSLQAYDQTAQTTGVTLRRQLSNVWSASLGISTAYNHVLQEGETRDYTLVAVPVTVLYDSTNLVSPLDDPHHGIRATLSVTPTLSVGHPNAMFVVTQATIAGYIDLHWLLRTSPGRSVLALRALGGLAEGAGEFDLPPDQRFYAGGSNTIRGYRYQSVGPQFPDGNPIGGTAINAASVEFRQRLGTSLGAAAFADAGRVSERLDPVSGVFRVGVGIGARYYSPVGPIRIDVAIPTRRRPNDDRFEIYIGLGAAF